MFQLISVVVAIALTAAVAVATLVYVPADLPVIERTAQQVVRGLSTLEAAFHAEARSAGRATGTGPAVSSSPQLLESSAEDVWKPFYSFVPTAPAGYTWWFGHGTHATLGATYYFCLKPDTGTTDSAAVRKGLAKAGRGFPGSQFVIHSACGASVALDPVGMPPAVTFWVRYVQDVS